MRQYAEVRRTPATYSCCLSTAAPGSRCGPRRAYVREVRRAGRPGRGLVVTLQDHDETPAPGGRPGRASSCVGGVDHQIHGLCGGQRPTTPTSAEGHSVAGRATGAT